MHILSLLRHRGKIFKIVEIGSTLEGRLLTATNTAWSGNNFINA
jgi:hypothetical protein